MTKPAPPTDEEIAQAIDALLGARPDASSICPSDAARRLRADEWRPLLPAVRRVAATLARAGRLRITQGAIEVSPQAIDAGTVRGPIRLRRPAGRATDEAPPGLRDVRTTPTARSTQSITSGAQGGAPQRPASSRSRPRN